jgi:iron complex outermembrane receptor protein
MKIDTQTLARLAAPLAALATVAAPTVTHAADDTLEEIVVTARKRTENLQDVPDSITAFSASMIEERRIDRIADAIEVTPGVHMISDQHHHGARHRHQPQPAGVDRVRRRRCRAARQ